MQITIPTPEVQPDGRVFIWFGKRLIEFPSETELVPQVELMVGDEQELLLRMAMLIMLRHPQLRGRKLAYDKTAKNNLLTVS